MTDCWVSGAVHTVTFANSLIIQERLVTVDEARRRLVHAVTGGRFTHHGAAMQVVPAGVGVRFVWTSDFLPDEAAPVVETLVDAGCPAVKRVLEGL